jgi:hypothetical protein
LLRLLLASIASQRSSNQWPKMYLNFQEFSNKIDFYFKEILIKKIDSNSFVPIEKTTFNFFPKTKTIFFT